MAASADKNQLSRRPLGATGMDVSLLGLGTVKWGRNQGVKYPAFELPVDSVLHELLDLAEAAGINLLDTAPAYGIAEERVGKILAQRRHSTFLVITKVGEEYRDGTSHYDFSTQATVASVERSLRRLGREALDVVLIHSHADDHAVLDSTSILADLIRLRDAGKARAIGLSTMTVTGGLKAVELVDVVMVPFSVGYREHLPVLERAAALGKGVFIKRALYSGPYADGKLSLHEHLMPVMAAPGVSSVIAGTINPRHLQENVNAMLKLTTDS